MRRVVLRDCGLDALTVALAFAYFETLVLRGAGSRGCGRGASASGGVRLLAASSASAGPPRRGRAGGWVRGRGMSRVGCPQAA